MSNRLSVLGKRLIRNPTIFDMKLFGVCRAQRQAKHAKMGGCLCRIGCRFRLMEKKVCSTYRRLQRKSRGHGGRVKQQVAIEGGKDEREGYAGRERRGGVGQNRLRSCRAVFEATTSKGYSKMSYAEPRRYSLFPRTLHRFPPHMLFLKVQAEAWLAEENLSALRYAIATYRGKQGRTRGKRTRPSPDC